MLDCLDSIENIWLKDKLFLTGNEINISDIFGACELEQLREFMSNPYFLYCSL